MSDLTPAATSSASVPSATRPAVWRWDTVPSATSELSSIIAQWDRLEELPGARVLKSNASRTVISLPASPTRRSLVIKKYRVRSTKERFKYVAMPSRARAEWRALEHLARNGVRVPTVLACGEAHVGIFLQAAGLIMETVTDTVPLPQYLEAADSTATERVMTALGAEVAGLHDAGCDHTDLHGGNVLVHRDGSFVTLIDHHVVKTFSFVPEFRRRSNLARLVHSMQGSVRYADLLSFLRGYDEARRSPNWDRVDDVLRKLEDGARRIENKRLKSRGRRCWLNSSDFTRETKDDRVVYRRREVDSAALDDLFSRDARLDPILKERRNYLVGVATIPVEGKPTRVVVKTHEPKSWLKSLAHIVDGGPLERAWGAARALDVRHIENPQALGLVVERRWGIPVRTMLVTRFEPDSLPLREDLLERRWPPNRPDSASLGPDLTDVADLIRRLHDSGVYHRDLNPMNVLVSRHNGAQRFSLVDLDSVNPGKLTDRRRRRNLVQLALLPEGHISARDRLRFLRAYDRGEGRFWNRSWVRMLDRELAEETVRIIARMSRQERDGQPPDDPRFD